MAFLCPARIKKFTVKSKRRRARRLSETDAPFGRITGSASVDTLVRVGLEKDQLELDPSRPRQRVLVLHDFQPCVDDELSVTRGQSLTVLYRENDWLYVMAGDGKEGFVPHVYCAPQGTAISDDIHVGARSTYLTNGAAAQRLVTATARAGQNIRGGEGGGSGGGGGGHSPRGNALNNRLEKNKQNAVHTQHATMSAAVRTSPTSQHSGLQTQANNKGPHYNNYNKQGPGLLNATSNSSASMANRSYTSAGPPVKNTSMTQTYTQVQPKVHNTSSSFARGREYNSSRSHANSNVNSSRNNYHSDSEDYLNMDNRSRFGRFQHHKYENVNVRNGIRGQGQGHVRHSSEDRSYGQHRPQSQQTRYHSLDRSGYGGYKREYRPLHNGGRNQGRQRHPSQDTYGQRTRQRSNSRESHNSSNMQSFQGQTRQNNSRNSGQNYTIRSSQSVNAQNYSNNSRLSNNSHHVSTNSSYSQNNSRIQGHSQSQLQGHSQSHRQGHYQQSRSGQQELDSVGSWGDQDRSSASDTPLLDTTEVTSFVKQPHGRYIVLFPFTGQEEGDVGVNRGEFVTMLNKDDADWSYIRRADGSEGFVPSSFLCPAEGQYEDIGNRLTSFMTPPRMSRQVSADSTRLVCLYDYAATAQDDLSITRGEWLYADLQDQVEDSWLWAYSPSTKRYGYVPRAYAKPPNTNGLIANPLDPYLSP